MLLPRRVKHRKVMRGRMSGQAKGGHYVAFGDYGLATIEPAWITSRQIEAARRAMTRSVKRGGKIWIRVFPDKPVTKKPAETRMGSGKGAPDHWVAVVKPGRILFEMAGVGHDEATEAMRLASHKLPVADPRRDPRGRRRGRRAMTDIAKVREMSDKELDGRPPAGQAGPLERPLRALDPAAQRHQQHPPDAANRSPASSPSSASAGPAPAASRRSNWKGRIDDGHDREHRRPCRASARPRSGAW